MLRQTGQLARATLNTSTGRDPPHRLKWPASTGLQRRCRLGRDSRILLFTGPNSWVRAPRLSRIESALKLAHKAYTPGLLGQWRATC